MGRRLPGALAAQLGIGLTVGRPFCLPCLAFVAALGLLAAATGFCTGCEA